MALRSGVTGYVVLLNARQVLKSLYRAALNDSQSKGQLMVKKVDSYGIPFVPLKGDSDSAPRHSHSSTSSRSSSTSSRTSSNYHSASEHLPKPKSKHKHHSSHAPRQSSPLENSMSRMDLEERPSRSSRHDSVSTHSNYSLPSYYNPQSPDTNAPLSLATSQPPSMVTISPSTLSHRSPQEHSPSVYSQSSGYSHPSSHPSRSSGPSIDSYYQGIDSQVSSPVSQRTHSRYSQQSDLERATTIPGRPEARLNNEQRWNAIGATANQRSRTHVAAQGGAWLAQAAAVATASAAGASQQAVDLTASMVSKTVSAALKEIVGEKMKMNLSHSATIDLPTESIVQRVGPRLMAGANDMIAAIASGMGNAAISSSLTPFLQSAIESRGVPPSAARPIADMLTAIVKGSVSAMADTTSDVASTAMKSMMSGARGTHKVNDTYDYLTAGGGIATRGVLWLAFSAPMDAAVKFGKVLPHGTDKEKTAAANALAWTVLNFWVQIKSMVVDELKAKIPSMNVTPRVISNAQPDNRSGTELRPYSSSSSSRRRDSRYDRDR